MLYLAVLLMGTVMTALAWRLGGGAGGLAYLGIYALATVPGFPIGIALFGRRHAAAWITGALVGYALTAVALWIPVELHLIQGVWSVTAWAAATTLSFALCRGVGPLVPLPTWRTRDTTALFLVLMVVPLLVARPFSRLGERDAEGALRYRAYFTADFLWHIALAAELSKGAARPRNPYLARRPLNYYWAYFVLPATITRTSGLVPSTQAALAINATCAGLLFVSALFVAAWCAVPRSGAVAVSVLLAVTAASGEGLFAIVDALAKGRPMDSLRHLNIDAITSWIFRGLTVDGLPRSLWYTPQHAAACALSLMAIVIPGSADATVRPAIGLLAGIALGLATIFSPFLGGAFCLIYGITALWIALRSGEARWRVVIAHSTAALPVLAALGWCVANGTFEGAGGGVALGISGRAGTAPVWTLVLALGPILVPTVCALVYWRRSQYAPQAALVGLMMGLVMFYFVTLTAEPIWIGWRAGQIILVTIPALAAACFATLWDRRQRAASIAMAVLIFCAGAPTTLIDAVNAQDIANVEMGPGFRWTVVVPPDSQAALRWIRENTPPDAVVQMSIGPRGRETWTLVPTFAERRMAAGVPISLLQRPEYTTDSKRTDTLFSIVQPKDAWEVARSMHIDYVYIDRIERQTYDGSLDKFDDTRFFEKVFRQGEAAVYAVR
jgi:hypothetical protein